MKTSRTPPQATQATQEGSQTSQTTESGKGAKKIAAKSKIPKRSSAENKTQIKDRTSANKIDVEKTISKIEKAFTRKGINKIVNNFKSSLSTELPPIYRKRLNDINSVKELYSKENNDLYDTYPEQSRQLEKILEAETSKAVKLCSYNILVGAKFIKANVDSSVRGFKYEKGDRRDDFISTLKLFIQGSKNKNPLINKGKNNNVELPDIDKNQKRFEGFGFYKSAPSGKVAFNQQSKNRPSESESESVRLFDAGMVQEAYTLLSNSNPTESSTKAPYKVQDYELAFKALQKCIPQKAEVSTSVKKEEIEKAIDSVVREEVYVPQAAIAYSKKTQVKSDVARSEKVNSVAPQRSKILDGAEDRNRKNMKAELTKIKTDLQIEMKAEKLAQQVIEEAETEEFAENLSSSIVKTAFAEVKKSKSEPDISEIMKDLGIKKVDIKTGNTENIKNKLMDNFTGKQKMALNFYIQAAESRMKSGGEFKQKEIVNSVRLNIYTKAASMLEKNDYKGKNAKAIARELAEDVGNYVERADYSKFNYKRHIGTKDGDLTIRLPEMRKENPTLTEKQALDMIAAENAEKEQAECKKDKDTILTPIATGVIVHLTK